MAETIYRINSAGVYATGHFGSLELKIDLGRPETCRQIKLSKREMASLMDVLGVDWEDGGYVHELLVGRDVLIRDDARGYPVSFSNVYGSKTGIMDER